MCLAGFERQDAGVHCSVIRSNSTTLASPQRSRAFYSKMGAKVDSYRGAVAAAPAGVFITAITAIRAPSATHHSSQTPKLTPKSR